MSKPLKLLIFEDSPEAARVAIDALRKGGFDPTYRIVKIPAELEAALRYEHWDAVISDSMTPDFSGADALGMVRSLGLDTPFVHVSDALDGMPMVGAMKAGASDCATKDGRAEIAPTLEREPRDTALPGAQRRSEPDPAESEERFLRLFDDHPLSEWMYDVETLRFLEVNDVACRTYGYTREEFLTMTVRDVRPSEDIGAMQGWTRTTDSQALGAGNWHHRRKDGTIFPVEIASREVTYQGRAARYVCPIDVTKRMRALEGYRKLAQAVEQSPAATVITDTEGRIEYVNAKFVEMSGYGAEELVGQTPGVIKSGLTPPAVYRDMWNTIKSGASWRGDLQNRKKNGELYWEHEHIAPLKNQLGEIVNFIAVKEDMTERNRAEGEVRRLNANLERRVVERTAELEAANSELQAFVHSVSHDLRAPLTRIRGFSTLVLEENASKLDEGAVDILRRIDNAGREMEQLIADLMGLSMVATGELRRSDVDVSALAQAVFDDLRRTQPDREVHFAVEPGLRARADPGLLRIVLENLLGNAWKFTRKRDGARIEMDCGTDGASAAAYFVRDNGAGFDQTDSARLFTPFQRLHAKSDFAGTGIGLATVQRIIRRHGGRVWAEGAVDRGATFHFTLAP